MDVLALAGDASDNVRGVKGIGTKGAPELIRQFGSLDVLLERASEVFPEDIRQRSTRPLSTASSTQREWLSCELPATA